jgi:octaprenyl-diphosphate synthase
MNLKEEDYFKIIISKTAALISACTACGARSVTDNADTIQMMKEFGENIGIAFQIKDDLLDYEGTGLTGKVAGNDIRERKLTLPLIYALEQAPASGKRHVLAIVKKRKKTKSEISEVINFVSEYGGMDYAGTKMRQFLDKSIAILDTYPDSEVKESLKTFVNYTASRKK